MDEPTITIHPMVWLGFCVIAVFLYYGVKAFFEWLPTFLDRFEYFDEGPYFLSHVESPVIKANGETGRAVFATENEGGEILLILDMVNGHDIRREYFHPKQKRLILDPNGERGKGLHTGPPIDVGKYQDLPYERRGFFFQDEEDLPSF